MKLSRYLLAAVLLALLSVAAIFYVSPDKRPRQVQAQAARVVFVDLKRLAQVQPASRTLAAMDGVLARARKSPRGGEFGTPLSLSAIDLSDAQADADRGSRQELESEMAQAAISALSQLESEQRQALERRVAAARAALDESSRIETDVQIREIRGEESSKIRELAQRLSWDRINAQLKVDALAAAMNSPGVDAKLTKPRLQEAQAELNRVESAVSTEEGTIGRDARSRIDNLLRAASEKIASAVSTYGSEETSRIEGATSAARHQILREMSSFDWLGSRGGRHATQMPVTNIPAVELPSLAVPKRGGATRDAREMSRSLSAIKERVRAEARRTVLILARERNVRVTFTRGSGVPDATGVFARLMMGRGAPRRPAIAGLNGS